MSMSAPDLSSGYFTIKAFPGGGSDSLPPSPVVSGTVIRLEALFEGKPLNGRITWTISGPFAADRRVVNADGPGWDWDTQGLRGGAYTVVAEADPPGSPPADPNAEAGVSDPFDLTSAGGPAPSPLTVKEPMTSKAITLVLTPAVGSSNADGVVPVSLQRTATVETPQQALWVIIRNRTNAIGWRRYKEFIDGVMCSDPRSSVRWASGNIPFRGTDAYTILKSATELFLMHEAGVLDRDFELGPDFLAESSGRLDAGATFADLDRLDPAQRERFLLEEQRRLGRQTTVQRLHQLRDAYYDELEDETVLPYLRLIRERLSEIPLKGEGEVPGNCYGILKSNLGGPVAMELIWSYWHEEGMLAQTLNAILARFQNRRATGSGPDPLARFDLDPLRPMSNLFWGFAQDEIFRLTVKRRAFEYEHEYGLRLIGKAIPAQATADRRSKFLESFHNLLYLTHVFYKEDDDTTVIADAFPVLNALRETHLVLAEGAHNQFGDLPSQARAEMLTMEWLLARPEIREFLGGRIMVPYEEEWMDRVDMMKTMQGWTDSTVTHFRDLGVFGEQLVLSIRYGNWSIENDPQEAANWARYWRPEIQRYAHAYRSATGVDLTERVDGRMPSTLLQQRLVSQRRA